MRWIGLVTGIVLAVLTAAHTALWFIAEARLQREAESWIAARRTEGWTITTGTVRRQGWPWAVQLRMPSIHVSTEAAGGLRFESELAEIGIDIRQPRSLAVRLSGRQLLGLGMFPAVDIKADQMAVLLPITGGPVIRSGDLVADGIHAEVPGHGTLTAAHITLHLATKQPTGTDTRGDESLQARIAAHDIAVPPNPADALGHTISLLVIDAALPGKPLRLPVTAPSLTAWRAAGGSVALRELALDWGPLSIHASGTLTLDERLQLAGLAQARITGENEALDVLTTARVVAPRAAMAARAILALLGKPQPGGPPVVDVPLTLQDRVLQVGRIPLIRLPELIWPNAP
jgi:hypothetical protein